MVFPAIINVYIPMSTFTFGEFEVTVFYVDKMDSCTFIYFIGGILFIGIVDNFGLYCGGERDLLFLQEKGNETPFTTFVGK